MRKCISCVWVLINAVSMAPLFCDNYNFNHHWNVVGEFVFMRRSKVHHHTLVEDSNKSQCVNQCPDYSVMSTKNLVNDFDFEPGYRVGLTYMPNQKISLEGNFLWLSEWVGEKTVHGDQSLSFPFKDSSFTQDFTNASTAKGIYKSDFWDAELNFWYHFTPCRINYFALAMIVGLRYFHLNERFRLSMYKPPDLSSYNTYTYNKIGGVQAGLDFQMNPIKWLSWEIFAKVGGMANYTKAKILLRDQDNQVKLRDTSKHEWESGIFTDIAAQFALHFTSWLDFHAGYEALFISGLSLAPEQLSKNPNSGRKDYTHGNAVIHGLYTGLIFSF